jgi:hypothetical protein
MIYLEREKLELVNRNIDKFDRLFSRCSKPLEFYDLANVINTIIKSDFEEPGFGSYTTIQVATATVT